jgi:peptide/nickel transport system permease protein
MTAELTTALVDAPAPDSAGRHGNLRILAQAMRLRRTQVGLGIFVLIVGIAALGPAFAPHSPTALVAPPFSGHSDAAVLGADNLGRDTLSRFLNGGRAVLLMAFSATALGVAAGIAIGLVAARTRSWLDELLMRSGDIVMAFPPIILAVLVVSTIGPRPWILVVTVAATHAPRVARLVRGTAMEVAERDYVAFADALGERRWRILLGDILPNIASPLLVEGSLRLAFSITVMASLSFLGFGLQPPAADWGLMVNENRGGLQIQMLPVVLPLGAIGALTIGVSLVADGIGRALGGLGREVS